MERREFLSLLACGAAVVTAGITSMDLLAASSVASTAAGRSLRATPRPSEATRTDGPIAQGPLNAAGALRPAEAVATYSPPELLWQAPRPTRTLALTVDDGYDRDTVAAYVQFAQDSGVHLTFSPNGCYAAEWAPHASVLRPLVEAGQVQLANHTYSHHDLRALPDSGVKAELERNEAWIAATFHTSARPYMRPPYGYYDARVNELSAQVGFSSILMWNATLGDDVPISPTALLGYARRYLQGGNIVVAHANHPTVTHLYPQLVALLRARQVRAVTLDEMFGTRRPL